MNYNPCYYYLLLSNTHESTLHLASLIISLQYDIPSTKMWDASLCFLFKIRVKAPPTYF